MGKARNVVKKDTIVVERKRRHAIHKFIMDGLANYVFFVPIFITLNTAPFFLGLAHWNLDNVITYVLTSLFGSFMMGGVFGRFLNVWRKKMNYH